MNYYLRIVFISILTHSYLCSQISDSSIQIKAISPTSYIEKLDVDIRFFGDYYVGVNEIMKENLRVYGGNLFVAGTVDGQIVVIGGDATLESTAVMNGRIVAIGGTIHKKNGAMVTGEIVEANIREGINIGRNKRNSDESKISEFDFNHDFYERQNRNSLSGVHPGINILVYNRNEGFIITPFNWYWGNQGTSAFKTSLSLGYRFGQREGAGRLSMEQSFSENIRPILFLSMFRESRTDDSYRLPVDENTLSSLFARQDFFDRWDELGYETGAIFRKSFVRASLAYRSVDITPFKKVKNLVQWFHKERKFRSIASFPEGHVTSVLGQMTIDNLYGDFLSTGFVLKIEGESVLSADSLDNFDRFTIALNLNRKLAPDIVFRSRIMAGESQGTLPLFRAFGVGGLGSVSAHHYKAQSGNRMLQLNTELLLLLDLMKGDYYLSLFVDLGNAWDKKDYSFTNFALVNKNSISAVGIGMGNHLDWRLNIAWPTNRRNVWETTFRFNLNF